MNIDDNIFKKFVRAKNRLLVTNYYLFLQEKEC